MSAVAAGGAAVRPVPRTQLTAFVPAPARAGVDEVRRRWDPVMAARIGAHLTVLRSLPDPQVVSASLAEAPPGIVRLRLSRAAHVTPLAAGGIFLAVEDEHGDWATLCQVLRRSLGPDADLSLPHVTLLHPRTTSLAQRERAWEVLSRWEPDLRVAISEVAVIRETGGGRWGTTGTIPLRTRNR